MVGMVMSFYGKLTSILSRLSFGNIKMLRTVAERERLLSALRESERRYRLLADNTLDVIWQMDLDLRFTYVNPAIFRVTGHTPDEWIGSRLPEHCDEDNFAMMAQVISEEVGKGSDSTGTIFEAVMLKKNREPIALEIHGKVIWDENGAPIALQGVSRDITDRKKVEEAHRESEERFSRSFENNPAFLAIVHMGTHKVLEVNDAWTRIFGYTREEAIGRTTEDLGIYDAKTYAQIMEEARTEGSVRNVEVTVKERTGKDLVLLVSRELIAVRDEPHLLAMGIDVTDLKKAEQALRESEEKYRTVVEESFDGVFVQKGQVITFANARLHEMLGYDGGELEGLDHWLIYHPDYQEVTRSRAQARLRGEPVATRYEVSLIRKDGTSFPGEINAKVIVFDKEPGIQVWIRDLTEQKLLEKRLVEAQKMEAVGTLAGGISHDFNNLLQIISGHAELLEMDFAERNMKFGEMTAIQQAAYRGAELVKQILTFSRKIDTKFESINLNEDVQNTERLLYRTIPKMIEIDLRLEEGLWPVRADSTQMEQMLINLAVNAKDAMPEGGTLTIETRNVLIDDGYCRDYGELVSGRYVLLKVSDTGHGMKEDVLQHIFEPFFTTKGLADGTGLGLATVFGIVKMHRGHINCESEAGKGTSFFIYLPATDAVRPDAANEYEAVAPPGGAETILVIDDESMIRKLATKILEKSGYSVLSAANGKEGIAIYAEHESAISLVILDLIMPEMSGKQCLEELLKINPQVKALIASGFAVEGDTKTFLDTKAKGIVAKPFDMRDLLRSVRAVLDGV